MAAVDDSQIYAQVTIGGELIMPDDKPVVQRILQAAAEPVITRTIVKEGKIIFCGEINILIKYETPVNRSIESIIFKVPFAHFIENDDAQPDMWAKLSSTIEIENFSLRDCKTIAKLILLKVRVVELQTGMPVLSVVPPIAIKNKCQSEGQVQSKQQMNQPPIVCPQCYERQKKRDAAKDHAEHNTVGKQLQSAKPMKQEDRPR